MEAAEEKIVYVDAKTAYKPVIQHPPFRVRPWHRYWAKMTDLFLFSLIADLVLFEAFHGLGDLNIWEKLLLNSCYILAWVPIEALFLSTLGATTGKWLFNIEVRDEQGAILSFPAALKRGLHVFIRGLGGGLPLISFLCLLSAHSTLGHQGTTSWDKGRFTVSHLPLGWLKKLVCIFAVVGYLLITFIDKFSGF